MLFMVLLAILATLVYRGTGSWKGFSAGRKRVHESKSKTQSKEPDPLARQEEQKKAVKNIVTYEKSIEAGRRTTETLSREQRMHAKDRTKLLRLLKEKIDGEKMRKSATRFTKGELRLLRKLNAYKKQLDEEETAVITLENNINKKNKELEETVNSIREERIRITELLEAKKRDDERKLLKLVKVLESVKSPQLAELLENIDQDLFVAIVHRMKANIFAKALSFMSKEKAITLNEKFLAGQK